MKIWKFAKFYIITGPLSYLIYIYPYEVINFLVFNENLFSLYSLIYALFFHLIIVYYLSSKNTFFLLKVITYQGMGIGFTAFWVVNIGLILSYFFSDKKTELGYISILIISLIKKIIDTPTWVGHRPHVRKYPCIATQIRHYGY